MSSKEVSQKDYDNLIKRHERLRGYVGDLVNDAEAARVKTNFACLISFAIGIAVSSFVYAVFL